MPPTGEEENYMIYVTARGEVLRFPKRARYKRQPNRVYLYGDFDEGEEVTFSMFTERPNGTADGYAWYFSPVKQYGQICHLSNLEPIEGIDNTVD